MESSSHSGVARGDGVIPGDDQVMEKRAGGEAAATIAMTSAHIIGASPRKESGPDSRTRLGACQRLV